MRKPVFHICEQQRRNQPADLCSLISAFVIRCLDRIISLLAIAEISRLKLVSVAEQACFESYLVRAPKTGFLVTRLKLLSLKVILARITLQN